MDYTYRIGIQRVDQRPGLELNVRVSLVPIALDVRFDNGPGIPSSCNSFTRNEVQAPLADALGSKQGAEAVLREAACCGYAERELPLGIDLNLVDRLCKGALLRKK
jgi:hypothetical protein